MFSFFRLDCMLQQFLQTRRKALSYLDLLETRTANFQNLQKPTPLEQLLQKPPKRPIQKVFALDFLI
ncbi:hypothetical protein [Polaromonas eurypsychrophila]|uniref:hypothetical protein n=1 Tax=Polaromonas eurypsychrophila TaxID=1614635 RepID=UPI001663AF11|nr:hypothetical protein [Polaromonas eurypsychrophila]